MTKRSPWFYGGIAVVVVLVLWVLTGYNGLVTARQDVDTAWSNVETQYQRRFDLIPNVVSTVKGAANFEQSTITAVTEARSQWTGASNRGQQVAAANSFDGALGRLIVSVEAYPQLKATEAFRDLTTELEGTENRIAVARRDYNDAVRSYNLVVRRFPGMILAAVFGYAAEPGFEATEGSENAPAVHFDQ